MYGEEIFILSEVSGQDVGPTMPPTCIANQFPPPSLESLHHRFPGQGKP